MSKTVVLKGIAWNHPRGYEPLKATSNEFTKMHSEVLINWDVRSLKEFGDIPIGNLTGIYDLITIDHPYMGDADAKKLLLPLEDLIPKNSLNNLKMQSVGQSFESYNYNNYQYALPIDAAALVAAFRNDLILKLNLKLPIKRSELFDFYKKIPIGHLAAWPLCATDLWCTFLTLCAQDGGRKFINDNTIEERIGIQVLDELKQHLKYLHPESINWNPIQILDCMSDGDEIVYSPFLFGYTNYSRTGYAKKMVNFGNCPINPNTDVSSILGGVGLAVSAQCKHSDLAVSYINYVASADVQAGIYTKHGGQPGNLIAWKNAENNVLCNNFFNNTLETMVKAYVRPQHHGWNQFQEKGADLLHQGIVKGISSKLLMKELNRLYQSII